MARFPKVPGAGAKAINNPVYWSRMHLQNQRYRARSRQAVERFNERKTRLFNIQNDVGKNIADAMIDLGVTEKWTEKEDEKWSDLIGKMKYWEEWCETNIEICTQGDLNKKATSLKNFVMYLLKLAIKYEAFSNVNSATYDAKRKMIVIDGEDYYYFGNY